MHGRRLSCDLNHPQCSSACVPLHQPCVAHNSLHRQGTLCRLAEQPSCSVFATPSPCALRYSAELLSSWPRSTSPVTTPMRTRSPQNSFCCSCRGPSSCWNSHRLRGRDPSTLFLLAGDVAAGTAAVGGALPAKLGDEGASWLRLGLWPLMWDQTPLASSGVTEPTRAALALLLLTPLTVLSMRSAMSVCGCCCWSGPPCPFSWLWLRRWPNGLEAEPPDAVKLLLRPPGRMLSSCCRMAASPMLQLLACEGDAPAAEAASGSPSCQENESPC
jgi:hypothetical protein